MSPGARDRAAPATTSEPHRPDPVTTGKTRSRYQRIAPIYDVSEVLAERRYRPWRRDLWQRAQGPRILEVGVGTGKNMPFYPEDAEITAIDLTPAMLRHAQRRAANLGLTSVMLRVGDVQALDLPSDSFDTAVATFVFCSVPDPLLGLQELARVVRPGGRVLLLEHVRSERPIVGAVMDLLNPLIVRLIGANINRRTIETVERSGLVLDEVEDLWRAGIFKRIVARTPDTKADPRTPPP